MIEGINVLSLFDGMSCGQLALQRAGIKVKNYFASEIDKHAIKVTMHNFPNTVQVGSVTDIDAFMFPKIDLIIGGSPCQGFSFAGRQLNFEDPRSKLFFEYVRLLNELRERNPDILFFLENVKMKKEYEDVISETLGVKPIFVCSTNFSAGKRKRLYWTNIGGAKELKETKSGLVLKDILEIEGIHVVRDHGAYKYRDEKAQCILKSYYKGADNHAQRTLIACPKRYLTYEEIKRAEFKHAKQVLHTGTKMGKVNFPTLQESKAKALLKTIIIIGDRSVNHIKDDKGIRLLTPIECERLQGVPDNYTSVVSNSQRYQMLGNGWNVDTIVYFFENIPYQDIF